ncbi:MAG TPA: membrane-bound lytic murein transglycosylase MltF [Spongiibacteraceae bacterium]|nr:membrane-bound lytic murein transglycosylase MltF [Spongiibacteraceae bacterium]
MTRPRSIIRWRFIAPLLLVILTGCGNSDHLQEIRDTGVLRVLTRNSPTTYFEDRNGPTGFEYELAQQFADYLGVKLKIETQPNIDGIYENLGRGRADLAAAGLAITAQRQQNVWFSPAYMDVEHLVLTRDNAPSLTSAPALKNARINVMAGSSAVEMLQELKQQTQELKWSEAKDAETLDLLDQLDGNEIDATVVTSNEFQANRAFYPELHAAFSIGVPTQLAWAVSKDPRNERLLEQLQHFFEKIKSNGELAQLVERYYTNSADNDRYDTANFTDNLERTLPKYRDLIEQVAEDYDLDWRLLAAVSYAESEWKPGAVSPTGVRGMMMLTNSTAKEMGVKDRVDPLQSLRGGARYLKGIMQELPSSIAEADRIWFALAIYNIGRGHVDDARSIADRQGKDPNRWTDVKDTLPLLQKSQYYEKTRNGYARGREPVRYVQNVRYYYNLLTWTEVAKQRTPPPRATDQYLPEFFDATLNAL